jgi:SAM-dependent methyltransferase
VDTAVYEVFREQYEENWYLKAREDVLAAFVARFCSPEAAGWVVDVGAGTGRVLHRIAPGHGVAVEENPDLIALARARYGLMAVRADLAQALPLRDRCAGLVLLLDVLEHVEDDRALLAEIRRVLRPGGWGVIAVPAFQALWSPHDEAHHHKRRYSRARLQHVVAAAELSCRHLTYYNTLLLPLVAGARVLDRLRGPRAMTDYDRPPGAIRGLLGWTFRQERRLVTRWRLPIGVSLLAVVRRES